MKVVGVVGAVACLATLTACGGSSAADSSASEASLKPAYDVCAPQVQKVADEANATGTDYLKYGNDGSLIVGQPSGGELHSMVAAFALSCTMKELKTPDAISTKIGQANASLGRQTDTWNGITVTYSYDGDSLSAIFTTS